MTDVLVRTLRLRGARASRLARAAAVELPAALERALADIEDVRIDTLSVRLDFEPNDLDDATIATLWADAIRREVLAAGGSLRTARERSRRVDEAAARHPSRVASRASDSVAEARRWLATAEPRGPVPAAALRLAETRIAAEAIASIGRREWSTLVAALVAALDHAPHGPRAIDIDEAIATEPRPGPVRTREQPVSSASPLEDERRRDADSPPHDEHGSRHPRSSGHDDAADRAAAARLASLAELMDPDATELDLTTVTRAAGLALLYPWLADVCREATSLHPGRDEATVRALALAALVDPDDRSLGADPLITVLSGAREPLDPRAPRLADADAVLESCDRALLSFASLLPGFASSSPDYVREQWIARAGVLDTTPSPMLLTAATHPLDVVLTRLPYPVALFALPWTAPIGVRFRP